MLKQAAVNFDKSELVPTQVFDFVGMHFNLRLGMVFVTEKNLAKVFAAAKSLSQVDRAPARQWQSLVGTLQAQVTLVPLSQLKLHPIQFHLHS